MRRQAPPPIQGPSPVHIYLHLGTDLRHKLLSSRILKPPQESSLLRTSSQYVSPRRRRRWNRPWRWSCRRRAGGRRWLKPIPNSISKSHASPHLHRLDVFVVLGKCLHPSLECPLFGDTIDHDINYWRCLQPTQTLLQRRAEGHLGYNHLETSRDKD